MGWNKYYKGYVSGNSKTKPASQVISHPDRSLISSRKPKQKHEGIFISLYPKESIVIGCLAFEQTNTKYYLLVLPNKPDILPIIQAKNYLS